MTGKVWRGSKKLLAFALTLVMVVGAMQTAPMVKAEEGQTQSDTSTETTEGTGTEGSGTEEGTTPLADEFSWPKITYPSTPMYNIASGKFKFKVTITSNPSTPIKCHVRNWDTEPGSDFDNKNNNEKNGLFKTIFEKSDSTNVVFEGGSGDVVCGLGETIYVWPVKKNEDTYFPTCPLFEGISDYNYFPYKVINPDSDYSTENGMYLYNLLYTEGQKNTFYEDTGNLIGWTPTISYDESTGNFTVTPPVGDAKLRQEVYFSKNAGEMGIRINGRTMSAVTLQDQTQGFLCGIQPDLVEEGFYNCYFWLETTGKRSLVHKKTIEYKRPANKLDQVTEIKWSATKAGTIEFNKLATETNVYGYYMTLYCRRTGYRESAFGQTQWVSNGGDRKVEYDLSTFMTEADAEYRVSIRTNTSAPLTVANSDEAFSDVYKPSQTTNTLKGKIDNATNKVAELKKADNQSALRIAMQTDQEMVNKIKEIENLTSEQKANMIDKSAVNNILESGDIEVVGAKLNATDAAQNMPKLTVASATQSGLDAKYKKTVPLSITLSACTVTNGKLTIPVGITMPVPKSIDKEKLVILHMKGSDIEETLYPRYVGDRISFTVTHFSTFVFAELEGKISVVGGGNGGSGGNGSGGRQDDTVEALITVAEAGATIKTKDITTLSNGTMKALLKRGDVTLVMEYTYQGVDYVVTIPAGKAVDNDIPWYGPLYLAGMYGNGTGADKADKTAETTYVVKRGDTMSKIAKLSGMSLAELAKKNPQIKNLNRIRVGQSINR